MHINFTIPLLNLLVLSARERIVNERRAPRIKLKTEQTFQLSYKGNYF